MEKKRDTTVQLTTSEMVLNVFVNGMWWIIKILLGRDHGILTFVQTGNVHSSTYNRRNPTRKDQRNVTYGMSKLFGHQLEQLTCLLKIRPSGLRICGLCAQECLISTTNVKPPAQLKMVPTFPVTHGIMGTPLALFKTWDFCLLQGCGHTCQRPVGPWKRLYSVTFLGLLARSPHLQFTWLRSNSTTEQQS